MRNNASMAMRASENERKGTAGQTKVKAKFEDLGWGANPNDDHDLGTDLWLHARDARRFDLGALVGAQVKSSDDEGGSYFTRPTGKNDVEGWWYSESSQDHFKYWTEHAIPHLLVLHDHETNQSYWVHVTKNTVVETGKGAKILVPAAQTLGEEHRDALLAVATSQRPGITWVGSAWSSQNKIYREDRLRYAAIAPRLIAPHPNAMPATLEPEQAIALLTQMRVWDLDFPHHSDRHYPTVEEAAAHDDWRWRLYAALRRYVDAGGPHSLDALTASATTPAERAASSALQAACFVESGRFEEAQTVLMEALRRNDATPADNAWLQVQRARCLRDLGDAGGAQRTALEIQKLRQAAPEDPTVLAICGAAADIVFSTSPLGDGDFVGIIAGRDTPTAWWRSQVMSTGLMDHFEGNFKQWANDESVVYGKADTAWLKLRAVSLMSGFAGDHASWRHSLSLLAQRQLMTCESDTAVEPVVSSLHDLRWAGDDKALEKATRRVVLEGPALAAREVARTINLARSTRTSVRCDIAFLKRAADVLDTETADRTVSWALQTIKNPHPFSERYQLTFAVWYDVMELLAATVPAASLDACRNVIEHLLAIPPEEDHHRALLYARVLEAINPSAWSNHDMEMLVARPAGDHEELKESIDHLLAQHDETTRERLIEQLRAGSLQPLNSLPDVRGLDAETVEPIIQVLREKLSQQREEASRGGYGIGGRDLGRTLTLLNMWHPEVADWKPIIELLADPLSAAHHLGGTLSVLSWNPTEVPAHIAEAITPLLREWMARTPVDDPFNPTDVRGPAADALNVLHPGALTNEDLWSLIGGTRDQRASAVLVIARRKNPTDINLLASFAQDEDVKVRATVASCLAGWVKEGVNPQEAVELLQKLLQDPGTRLARSVSGTLANTQPEDLQKSEILVEILRNHISADVRQDIKRTLP